MMIVPKMREPNVRIAKKRKIENIWRDVEQKKSELHGTITPSMFRNPRFYFAVIFLMTVVAALLFHQTDSAVTRKRHRESPEARVLRHLDTLATALGRYHLHVGRYPTLRQGGLGALVRDPGQNAVPDWQGPYINVLSADPWGRPFEYAPPTGTNQLPTLFSCGPDHLPNTADDLRPDPAKFDPGTDWTNGWLRAADRYMPGVTVGNQQKAPAQTESKR